MGKKTNKDVKYLQIPKKVLRKEKTKDGDQREKGKGTYFRLKVYNKVSLWKSHLSCTLRGRKEPKPKRSKRKSRPGRGKSPCNKLQVQKSLGY